MSCACPQCSHPVSYRRRWLGSHFWARWACPNCGAELKWSFRHRLFATIPAALGIMLMCVFLAFWPPSVRTFALYGLILLVLMEIVTSINRPELVKFGHSVCILCGYDLRGTPPASDGSRLCPECGAPNVPLADSSTPSEPRP